jgi:hypothetical protein
VATLTVQPRRTPEERADVPVDIEVDDALTFDQLDAVDDTGQELVLRLEERDGIAELARCTSTGLEVELHHILTFT